MKAGRSCRSFTTWLPGAGLAFHTAENSEADFAAGIEALAAPVANGGAGPM